MFQSENSDYGGMVPGGFIPALGGDITDNSYIFFCHMEKVIMIDLGEGFL